MTYSLGIISLARAIRCSIDSTFLTNTKHQSSPNILSLGASNQYRLALYRLSQQQAQMTCLLVLLFSILLYGRAQQTFFPASIPLLVRSSTLNCWCYMNDKEDYDGGLHAPAYGCSQLTCDQEPCLTACHLLVQYDAQTDCTLGPQSCRPCPCR